jgi:hypothetical protein
MEKTILNSIKIAGLTILKTISKYLISGIFLNIGFLLISIPQIISMFRGFSNFTPKIFISLLMFLMLLFIFPILFFILGKANGFKKGLAFLLENHLSELLNYIYSKFKEKYNVLSTSNIEKFKEYVQTFENFPVPAQKLFKKLFNKLKIEEEFEYLIGDDLSEDELIQKVSENLESKIQDEFLNTENTKLSILLVLNITAFIVFKAVL